MAILTSALVDGQVHGQLGHQQQAMAYCAATLARQVTQGSHALFLLLLFAREPHAVTHNQYVRAKCAWGAVTGRDDARDPVTS